MKNKSPLAISLLLLSNLLFFSCELDPDFEPEVVFIPTCNDGMLNGNETAIDCGGIDCDPCPEPIKKWWSSVEATGGEFNEDLGLKVLEVDDGYIVFGLYTIAKFNLDGGHIRSVTTEFFISDIAKLSSGNIFISSTSMPEILEIDIHLNQTNVATVFENSYKGVIALGSYNQELMFLGQSLGGGFPSSPVRFPIPVFGSNSSTSFPNDFANIYLGEPLLIHCCRFADLVNFHLETDEYLYTELYDEPQDQAVLAGFPFNQATAPFFTPLGTLKPILGFAEKPNGDVLIYGIDNSQTAVFRTVSSSTGQQIGNDVQLCSLEVSTTNPYTIGLTSTSGGYVLASRLGKNISGAYNSCDTDFPDDTKNGDIRLQKFDLNLNIVWERIYEIPNDQIPYNIITTSDGGYVISGYTRTDSKDQFLLIKTDADGLIN